MANPTTPNNLAGSPPGVVVAPSGKTTSQSTQDHEESAALKKFVETQGHFSLVRNFRLADAFTLMNAFCASQSFFNSARYLSTGDTRYAWLALWCPFFGAIFDLLDGKIARWRGGGSMLGQELDSLADSISFGAAPSLAAYTLGLRTPIDTLILTCFICAGVARLARFNVTTALVPHDASGKAKYFEGLPIPTSLILVGGMATCLLTGKFQGAGSVQMTGGNWQFTNRLVPYLAKTPLVSGKDSFLSSVGIVPGYQYDVPFGLASIDLADVAKLIGLNLKGITWARLEDVKLEFHWISLLWLGWSVAMASKTLRVPKP